MRSLVTVIGKPGFEGLANDLADKLSLDVASENCRLTTDFQLRLTEQGLFLTEREGQHKGIHVDFIQGSLRHRRLYGGGKNQQIGKAVGLSKGFKPNLLDLTAGLGRDGFVLASLGARVQLCERNPVIYALLYDGLHRAKQAAKEDADIRQIIERITLAQTDAFGLLEQIKESTMPDVIYLDPMFPARDKSALVKKEMALLHGLLGQEQDADKLLEPALEKSLYRVVVKRPAKAPFLSNKAPSYSYKGKSTRFDIYSIKKLPC